MNQTIECTVTDCINCKEYKCILNKIQISNDERNEYSKYNTMCQSYEKK